VIYVIIYEYFNHLWILWVSIRVTTLTNFIIYLSLFICNWFKFPVNRCTGCAIGIFSPPILWHTQCTNDLFKIFWHVMMKLSAVSSRLGVSIFLYPTDGGNCSYCHVNIDGVWIDNWIYWITLNYSVHTTVDSSQSSVAMAPQLVFHSTVSAQDLLQTRLFFSHWPSTNSGLRTHYWLHWLTEIPLPQPGPSIHLLARTHRPPNQDTLAAPSWLITNSWWRRTLLI
jgi:hypothetical protein